MVAALEKRSYKDFDWIMTALALAIVSFGVWQIYNAQPTEALWQKQIVGIFVALIAMVVVATTDYRRLIEAAPIFYAIGIFLLIIVLIPGIGLKINGQRCWIKIPFVGMQFQPSEFMKIPVVLMLAKYFGNRRVGVLTVKEIVVGIAIVALPLGLIMLEPDAGQSLTYIPLLAVVLFLSGVKLRWVILSILFVVVSTPLLWTVGVYTGKIKPYQQERLKVILDPENVDPRGYGYHTIQSMVAVGKGGLTGSTAENPETSQSALKFLPEPHSDFIYAVTAENTGFVGCITLLLAYLVLLSRMIDGARHSSDRGGMLVIMAFVGGMSFQIFLNVGMVLGFLPVVGVPLPLMSAGVSAVLSTFIVIGFAISVRMRRFVN